MPDSAVVMSASSCRLAGSFGAGREVASFSLIARAGFPVKAPVTVVTLQCVF